MIGEPVDLAGAEKLAEEDKYQFQWWALSLAGARPLEKKKGADQGIMAAFISTTKPRARKRSRSFFSQARTPPGHPRARLARRIEREKSETGMLISMQPPTKPMQKEAAEAGFYQVPGLRDKYPRLQILSIAELLDGKRVEYRGPPPTPPSRKPPRRGTLQKSRCRWAGRWKSPSRLVIRAMSDNRYYVN